MSATEKTQVDTYYTKYLEGVRIKDDNGDIAKELTNYAFVYESTGMTHNFAKRLIK